MALSSAVILAASSGQSLLASLARMSCQWLARPLSKQKDYQKQHTSDFVQTTPTLLSEALRASSNTSCTPASVVARPIRVTAKTWWHCRTYLSVTFCRAELRSRRPRRISTTMASVRSFCLTWKIRYDQPFAENVRLEIHPKLRYKSGVPAESENTYLSLRMNGHNRLQLGWSVSEVSSCSLVEQVPASAWVSRISAP